MNQQVSSLPRFRLTRRAALVVALVGAALCGLGWWRSPQLFYQAYLLAFLIVSSVSLGCAAVLMIHHLVGGCWGFVSRRILEAGTWLLLVLPLAAVPLYFGIEDLYVWSRPEVVEHDALLQEKSAWLNQPMFVARSAVYLALWALLGGLLCGLSPRQGANQQQVARRQSWLAGISGIGLVAYGLSVTFAATDWMMSLEPHWFSSIYGVVAMAGQGVAGFAIPIAMLAWLRGDPQVDEALRPTVSRDLGNLLLAATTFWMYITFSQFLIIWSGNLTEEIPWYLARSSLGWKTIAAALVTLHLVLPFGLLLSPDVKRNPSWLAAVAGLLLVMHAVDIFWLIMPALRETLWVNWLDFVCLFTLIALWLVVVQWRLARHGAAANFAEPARGNQHGSIRGAKPAH